MWKWENKRPKLAEKITVGSGQEYAMSLPLKRPEENLFVITITWIDSIQYHCKAPIRDDRSDSRLRKITVHLFPVPSDVTLTTQTNNFSESQFVYQTNLKVAVAVDSNFKLCIKGVIRKFYVVPFENIRWRNVKEVFITWIHKKISWYEFRALLSTSHRLIHDNRNWFSSQKCIQICYSTISSFKS